MPDLTRLAVFAEVLSAEVKQHFAAADRYAADPLSDAGDVEFANGQGNAKAEVAQRLRKIIIEMEG